MAAFCSHGPAGRPWGTWLSVRKRPQGRGYNQTAFQRFPKISRSANRAA